jgi:hypothetical protein
MTFLIIMSMDKVDNKPGGGKRVVCTRGKSRYQAQKRKHHKQKRKNCMFSMWHRHFTNMCPEMKKQLTSIGDENQIHTLNATWEASMYRIQMMRETL